MSYNIDKFEVKKIRNFKIFDIYKILYKIEEKIPEFFKIEINEDTEEIKDIIIHGERSGNFWNDIFQKILINSSGYLKALMVWEQGDLVEFIEIDNGRVKYIKV